RVSRRETQLDAPDVRFLVRIERGAPLQYPVDQGRTHPQDGLRFVLLTDAVHEEHGTFFLQRVQRWPPLKLVVLPFFEDGDAVLTPKPEPINQNVAHLRLSWFPRHIIQVALRICSELVDSWRDTPSVNGLDGRHRAQGAGRAEQMADHRLHRAHRDL